jgi:hypothetical protein
MGGNAFPGKTRRYDADEYFALVEELKPKFALFASRFDVIPAYKTKPSFGDMDVLYTPSKPVDNHLLKDIFGTFDLLKNGDVWSLVYKQFQIDLIHSPAEEYDYALAYFSWNDFGNLVGRLTHKFGLKHGHDGLKFPVRSADHILGEVILTRDPRVTFNFIDVHPPAEGFDTLEQMFDCVIASKYFSKELFAFENRNHTARVRDRKRTSYNSFLKYIEQRDDLPSYKFERDKSKYVGTIFEAFPHAKDEYDRLWAKKEMLDRVREKFNGDLVRQWTGFDGIDLGRTMKSLKTDLTPEVVDAMSADDVKQFVLDFVQAETH